MSIEFFNEKDLNDIPKPEILPDEVVQIVAELQAKVEEQATLIANQAIIINEDREKLNKVDSDLNALVG